MSLDGLDLPENTYGQQFADELTKAVIHEEIKYSEGYQSLSAEQRKWFEKYAGPALVTEGLETGRAASRELGEGGQTRAEILLKETAIFLDGASVLNEELGR